MQYIVDLVEFTKTKFKVEDPATQLSPCTCRVCELCRDIQAGADMVSSALVGGYLNIPVLNNGVHIITGKLEELKKEFSPAQEISLADLIRSWQVVFGAVEKVEELAEKRLNREEFH